MLQEIRDKCGGLDLSFLREMPLEEAKAWLKELPGVGPKTAAIVLCFALGMPAMPVDTHIYRVSKRLGLIGEKVTADQAHDILEASVSPEQVFGFHVYLITHGRQVCKARRPLCDRCVLSARLPLGVSGVGRAAPPSQSSPFRGGRGFGGRRIDYPRRTRYT